MGYTSGSTPAPNYDDLGDHTEALRLEFDEDVVSYEALVEQFWDLHAPNKGSRQYRSAIFYHDEAQRECAERVQAQLAAAVGSRNGGFKANFPSTIGLTLRTPSRPASLIASL